MLVKLSANNDVFKLLIEKEKFLRQKLIFVPTFFNIFNIFHKFW